jgi:hypothetical protein
VSPDLIDRIPGKLNDRKTPLGELNWIFTAITDTIAWNVLPRGNISGVLCLMIADHLIWFRFNLLNFRLSSFLRVADSIMMMMITLAYRRISKAVSSRSAGC